MAKLSITDPALFMQLKRIAKGEDPSGSGKALDGSPEKAYLAVKKALPADHPDAGHLPAKWENCAQELSELGAVRKKERRERASTSVRARLRVAQENSLAAAERRGGCLPAHAPRTQRGSIGEGESFIPFVKGLAMLDGEKGALKSFLYEWNKTCGDDLSRSPDLYWNNTPGKINYFLLYDIRNLYGFLFGEEGKITLNENISPQQRTTLETKYLQLACGYIEEVRRLDETRHDRNSPNNVYAWSKTWFSLPADGEECSRVHPRAKGLEHMKKCYNIFSARLKELGAPLSLPVPGREAVFSR